MNHVKLINFISQVSCVTLLFYCNFTELKVKFLCSRTDWAYMRALSVSHVASLQHAGPQLAAHLLRIILVTNKTVQISTDKGNFLLSTIF